MANLPDIIATLAPDRPVLIAGPTASGKSGLAAAIADAQGGVIVNADALQVYAKWRVLTARPSPAEESAHPHHLYGHVAQDQPYSVGHWLRDIAPLLNQDQRPIIVGGTGLYFTALTEGLVDIPPTPAAIRAVADARRATAGIATLLAELDPATTARIDTANPARIQRAWEVQAATGRGLAAWQAETGAALLPLAKTHAIVLRPDPVWLGNRIDSRFDLMMADGALDEARAALPGWNPALPANRAIGAPDLIAHLQGHLDLQDAISAAKLASRQYAKRQRTWFRNRMANWIEAKLP